MDLRASDVINAINTPACSCIRKVRSEWGDKMTQSPTNHLPPLTKKYRKTRSPHIYNRIAIHSMSNQDTKSPLAEAFASGVLDSLQKFWFSHQQDETHIVVPSTADINVWFVDKSDEFDELFRYVSIFYRNLRVIASSTTAYSILNPEQNLDRYSTPSFRNKQTRKTFSQL
jgi:hypothetical protein